jgi:anti-anti-sigma factor
MADGTARYAFENGTWFLKLEGDLRHPLGPALNALLDQAFADPRTTQFVIDLSGAESIDSTCLGILARIGNESARRGAAKPTIISPNADINEVLLATCFDLLFRLVTSADVTGDRLHEASPVDGDPDSMLALILEAHRRLCAIDERTHSAFREVVRALEDDLRNRGSDPSFS